jgi:hypothetical protein
MVVPALPFLALGVLVSGGHHRVGACQPPW